MSSSLPALFPIMLLVIMQSMVLGGCRAHDAFVRIQTRLRYGIDGDWKQPCGVQVPGCGVKYLLQVYGSSLGLYFSFSPSRSG